MQNQFTSVLKIFLVRPTLGKIETTLQIGKALETVRENTILTLRGQAREEQISKTSQFVQAVLSQTCDYSPVSVNAVLELAKFYLN